jgi:predicted esterase
MGSFPDPEAGRWYPHSFLAPIEDNQPYLDASLALIGSVVSKLPGEQTALLGFSQGACLTLEFVARNPRRYGAVIGLTGGLIGPPGTVFEHTGSLSGTPVFLGTSDPDPHVPFSRVQETQAALTRMGSQVELRRYPGMPHTINEDELDACRQLIQNISRREST